LDGVFGFGSDGVGNVKSAQETAGARNKDFRGDGGAGSLRELDSPLKQEMLIANDDLVISSCGGDDAFTGGVVKLGGIFKGKA